MRHQLCKHVLPHFRHRVFEVNLRYIMSHQNGARQHKSVVCIKAERDLVLICIDLLYVRARLGQQRCRRGILGRLYSDES